MNNKQCKLCEGSLGFHGGLKGKRADLTKILFVAHRPDGRVLERALPDFNPYEEALARSWTGKKIAEMLKYCKLDFDDVYWTNIFKCVLAKDKNTTEETYGACPTRFKYTSEKDRNPRKKEYENCLKIFIKQLQDFNPKKMVLFGPKVYDLMFPKDRTYENDLYNTCYYQEIPTLILPHSSKRWRDSKEAVEKEVYQSLSKFLNTA